MLFIYSNHGSLRSSPIGQVFSVEARNAQDADAAFLLQFRKTHPEKCDHRKGVCILRDFNCPELSSVGMYSPEQAVNGARPS